jgi:hypothetical protein
MNSLMLGYNSCSIRYRKRNGASTSIKISITMLMHGVRILLFVIHNNNFFVIIIYNNNNKFSPLCLHRYCNRHDIFYRTARS